MVEINCIKIREYNDFVYFGFKVSNIWKGYDEEEPEEIFMFFDIKGNGIYKKQTFSRSITLKDLKKFIKEFGE